MHEKEDPEDPAVAPPQADKPVGHPTGALMIAKTDRAVPPPKTDRAVPPPKRNKAAKKTALAPPQANKPAGDGVGPEGVVLQVA